MRLLIIILLVSVFCFVVHFTYLSRKMHLPSNLTLKIMKLDICTFFHKIQKCVTRWQLEQHTFCINYNLQPYINEVEKLGICKYFRFNEDVYVGNHIFEFRFKILGISPIYKSDQDDLIRLLAELLQQFYKERVGYTTFPFVYPTAFDGTMIYFWIASSLYGNYQIQQRIRNDSVAKEPHEEAIEDD